MAQGPQEAVMLFNAEGNICEEMRFASFEQHLQGEATLDSRAASTIKAV